MKVKELKELLSKHDDELQVMIRNTINPIGNIEELEEIEEASFSFFGESVKCIILNTYHSFNKEEINEYKEKNN